MTVLHSLIQLHAASAVLVVSGSQVFFEWQPEKSACISQCGDEEQLSCQPRDQE